MSETKVTGTKNADGTITLSLTFRPESATSASGKSVVLASTHGNQPLPESVAKSLGLEGAKIGFNLYRKN